MTSKILQPKNKEKRNLYSKIGDLSFASLMGKGWYSLQGAYIEDLLSC